MTAIRDVIGVGIGPFNLSLAALLDSEPDVDALFFERRPRFEWHPGLMMEGTTLQVPFLADLVTLADPTNRWSFLNYLKVHGRQYHFYFLERFHIPRREYDHYCRWVANSLPSCRYGADVEHITWHDRDACFDVIVGGESYLARNVVLGVGTEPSVPGALRSGLGPTTFHSAEFLHRRDVWQAAGSVTVVGSGQSGAEVFLTLLREQPECGYRLDWITRGNAFLPMEYSKLGLEHFTPDYVDYFFGLTQKAKDDLLPRQGLLYKGIDTDTIAEIFELLYERTVGGHPVPATLRPLIEIETIRSEGSRHVLEGRHLQQGAAFVHETECLVLATGYAAATPKCLDGLNELIVRDELGRHRICRDYRLQLRENVFGSVFVQNGELHTHGVGTPDLGLGAYRASIIAAQIAGREPEKLGPTAFTRFGIDAKAHASI
jgi:lysine N6-hydroxylase